MRIVLDMHITTCSSLLPAAGGRGFEEEPILEGSHGAIMNESLGTASWRKPPSGNWRRQSVDVLRDKLNLLDGNDRALMEMYLDAGSSFRQMARLAGVNEVTVARRIRSMTRRLVNGQYLNCLRHRERLTAMELKVAKDYYLKALPIRRISVRRGWSYYHAQRTVAKIRRLLGETIQPTEMTNQI